MILVLIVREIVIPLPDIPIESFDTEEVNSLLSIQFLENRGDTGDFSQFGLGDNF